MAGKISEIPIILTVYATFGMLDVYLSVFQYTILAVTQLFRFDIAVLGVLIGM